MNEIHETLGIMPGIRVKYPIGTFILIQSNRLSHPVRTVTRKKAEKLNWKILSQNKAGKHALFK